LMRLQVDAPDDALVLARPVPSNEFHLLGVGLVERGIIEHEQAFFAPHEAPGLLPQGRRIRRLSREQACEGVVGGGLGRERLATDGLYAGEDMLGSNQEGDVVSLRAARCIHGSTPLDGAA
jgi:hypothetical protein